MFIEGRGERRSTGGGNPDKNYGRSASCGSGQSLMQAQTTVTALKGSM